MSQVSVIVPIYLAEIIKTSYSSTGYCVKTQSETELVELEFPLFPLFTEP